MPDFKNPNPPFQEAPPYDVVPTPATARPRHRRWIVHSHEATRPAHSGSMSDINITPLIDVMLVLLIIFMVVTPLAQKGLDIALPQATPPQPLNAPPPPSNQVVLGIEDSPSGAVITVNKSPVANMEELDQRLKDIFQTKSDKTIFVKASGKILYGKVVEAMDIARGAGVERIGIISEKMIEQAGGVVEGGGGGQ
jgi:biopolymer transport protein ExbD/biopolymer transport protein TolR